MKFGKKENKLKLEERKRNENFGGKLQTMEKKFFVKFMLENKKKKENKMKPRKITWYETKKNNMVWGFWREKGHLNKMENWQIQKRKG